MVGRISLGPLERNKSNCCCFLQEVKPSQTSSRLTTPWLPHCVLVSAWTQKMQPRVWRADKAVFPSLHEFFFNTSKHYCCSLQVNYGSVLQLHAQANLIKCLNHNSSEQHTRTQANHAFIKTDNKWHLLHKGGNASLYLESKHFNTIIHLIQNMKCINYDHLSYLGAVRSCPVVAIT